MVMSMARMTTNYQRGFVDFNQSKEVIIDPVFFDAYL